MQKWNYILKVQEKAVSSWNSLPCLAWDRRSRKDRKRSGHHCFWELIWPLEKACRALGPVQICSFGLEDHVKLQKIIHSLYKWNVVISSNYLGGWVTIGMSILPTRAESWVRASPDDNWSQNFYFIHSAFLSMWLIMVATTTNNFIFRWWWPIHRFFPSMKYPFGVISCPVAHYIMGIKYCKIDRFFIPGGAKAG